MSDTVPGYQAGWVHEDLCEALERFSIAVAERKSPRLIIQAPPRHGKSIIASERFPVWHLGRNPTHQIIASSYAASLASTFSKRARALVSHPITQETFSTLKPDDTSQSVEYWQTTQGGAYRAAGVGGGITGQGGDVLIVDDPVKDAEEANSETIREKIWEWYTSTAYTRLLPGGGVLIIMTRWHGADLVGRLLKESGEDWEVITYPAIAEQDEPKRKAGEPLHPERYSVEALNRIKEAVGPYYWAALYQQRPTAREGQPFTELKYAERDHKGLRLGIAIDMAYGKKSYNDFTATVIGGTDAANNLFELFYHEGRMNIDERIAHCMRLMRLWQPRGLTKLHIECTEDFVASLKREQEAQKFYFPIVELEPKGIPKERRIEDTLVPEVAAGRLWFQPGSKLAQRLLAWSPTNGEVDDGPDALQYLRKQVLPAIPVEPEEDWSKYSPVSKMVHDRLYGPKSRRSLEVTR